MKSISNAQAVQQFHVFLHIKKGLGEKTISAHMDNIQLLANYLGEDDLKNSENASLLSVDGIIIEEFLGTWYVSKVLASSRSQVIPILRSIKAFYRFLWQSQMIDQDQYDSIVEECKNPRKYQKRFDSYDAIEFESEKGAPQWETWCMGGDAREDDPQALFSQPNSLQQESDRIMQGFQNTLAIIRGDTTEVPIHKGRFAEYVDEVMDVFQEIVPALNGEFASLVRTLTTDFGAFLQYCQTNPKIFLTKAHGHFQQKDIQSLNLLLKPPDIITLKSNQPYAKTIHLFSTLTHQLALISVGPAFRLELGEYFCEFLSLPPASQYCVLLYTLWNHVKWATLLRPNDGGRPEWAQAERQSLAEILLTGEPETRQDYNQLVKTWSHARIAEQSPEIAKKESNGSGDNRPLRVFSLQDLMARSINFEDDSLRICLDWGVIPERIFPAFRRFGLLQFQYDPDRDAKPQPNALLKGMDPLYCSINWFAISTLGKLVITILHQTPVTTYNTKVN